MATTVQPILSNRHARGLSLDARILESCGCPPAVNLEDPLQSLAYFLGPGRTGTHLFIEKLPWWSVFLPPNRVWLLWNHEIKKSYARFGNAGVILCKTEVGMSLARERCSPDQEVRWIGFTSWAEAELEHPEPSAAKPGSGILHIGGQSGHKQTQQVLEAWLNRPDFPILTAVCFWGCCEVLCPQLLERVRQAPNIVWHDTPLPASQLQRYRRQNPIHLHPSAAEGFGHSLNQSRGDGALIVATGAPPMNEYANVHLDCTSDGVWSRVSSEAIERGMEEALGMSLEDRVKIGKRNQAKAAQEHSLFRERISDLLQGNTWRPEPTSKAPYHAKIRFFMGKLPARTGGEAYNETCIQALRAAGRRVKYHWISPYRSLSVLGLLPSIGPFLSSPFLALFFSWRRGLFVVDQHFLEPMLLTNLLRKKFGLGPLVVVAHHLEHYTSCQEAPPPGLKMAYHRWLLSPADKVIAVSEYTRDEILSLGIASYKLHIVSPGCVPSSPKARLPCETFLRCLVIGRCEARKDWPTLLEAVARMESVQLRIAGSLQGEYYQEVIQPLVKALQLGDRVHFEGQVSTERREELFAWCDVLVHPSRQEGFGIVILEALQRGRPVISTYSSAIPELIEDGFNGLLFPPGDKESLRVALNRLAEDPELLEQLSSQAPERALNFDWSRTGREFVKTVAPMLQDTPEPPRGAIDAVREELRKYTNCGLKGLIGLGWRWLAMHLLPLPKSLPKSSRELPIVTTLTTIPSRLKYLKAPLNSLLRQTEPPDAIVLCLPQECQREGAYTIPKFLQNSEAVTVLRCPKDWGPATKFIPTWSEFGEQPTRFLVVDDDNVYPKNMVETFLKWSAIYPEAALAYRGHKIGRSWKEMGTLYASHLDVPTPVDLVTGTWGFLVRESFFDSSVMDYSGYPEAAFYVDDIWFNGHLAKRGIERMLIPASHPPLPTISAYREALGVKFNSDGTTNDQMIQSFATYW